MGRRTRRRARAAEPARRCCATSATLERATPSAPDCRGSWKARFTHVLLLDGDMQHLPARGGAADCDRGRQWCRRRARRATILSREHARLALSRQPARQRVLSWFIGVRLRDTQCGFRIFRVDCAAPIRLTGHRLRDRNRDAGQGPATRRPPGQRADHRGVRQRASKLRPVRDTTRTCFLAVYYRFLERV